MPTPRRIQDIVTGIMGALRHHGSEIAPTGSANSMERAQQAVQVGRSRSGQLEIHPQVAYNDIARSALAQRRSEPGRALARASDEFDSGHGRTRTRLSPRLGVYLCLGVYLAAWGWPAQDSACRCGRCCVGSDDQLPTWSSTATPFAGGSTCP